MTTSSLGSWARAERGGTRLLASVGKPSFGVCGDCESLSEQEEARPLGTLRPTARRRVGLPRPSPGRGCPSQPSGSPPLFNFPGPRAGGGASPGGALGT